MELRPHNFDTLDFDKDAHLILTSKFMQADRLAEQLEDRGEDPFKQLVGPYGEHRYLAFESKKLEPQFYMIGQEIWQNDANITRYLMYRCIRSERHSLPFASTRQEFISHEDTIFVSGEEQLYSLVNDLEVSDRYYEELVNEISNFSLALYWPLWAENNDWIFEAFHRTK